VVAAIFNNSNIKQMSIKTKLTEKEYVKASLATATARPNTRFILGIFGFIILVNIIMGISRGATTISSLLPPIIIFSIFLAIFYFGIKKGYSKNKRISELIEYTFDNSNLLISGESFKTELSWNKIDRVSKSKSWLLIWQNRQSANAIPMKDVFEDDLTKLKTILTNNQVKNNL